VAVQKKLNIDRTAETATQLSLPASKREQRPFSDNHDSQANDEDYKIAHRSKDIEKEETLRHRTSDTSCYRTPSSITKLGFIHFSHQQTTNQHCRFETESIDS
jgi:hypothetical protein